MLWYVKHSYVKSYRYRDIVAIFPPLGFFFINQPHLGPPLTVKKRLTCGFEFAALENEVLLTPNFLLIFKQVTLAL
jgi:hypothetical protein